MREVKLTEDVILKEVLYVLSFFCNLVSISKLTDTFKGLLLSQFHVMFVLMMFILTS